jgi:hypothetical protein
LCDPNGPIEAAREDDEVDGLEVLRKAQATDAKQQRGQNGAKEFHHGFLDLN